MESRRELHGEENSTGRVGTLGGRWQEVRQAKREIGEPKEVESQLRFMSRLPNFPAPLCVYFKYIIYAYKRMVSCIPACS